jgi:hypothetical protein
MLVSTPLRGSSSLSVSNISKNTFAPLLPKLEGKRMNKRNEALQEFTQFTI